MKLIPQELVQSVSESDPLLRSPDLMVDYAFEVGGAQSTSAEFVNIQTVWIGPAL